LRQTAKLADRVSLPEGLGLPFAHDASERASFHALRISSGGGGGLDGTGGGLKAVDGKLFAQEKQIREAVIRVYRRGIAASCTRGMRYIGIILRIGEISGEEEPFSVLRVLAG